MSLGDEPLAAPGPRAESRPVSSVETHSQNDGAAIAEARVHKAQINPDIDSISSLSLYEGQRVRHELVYGVVKDRKTGAFHHDYASFRTLRKTKATPWKADQKASFTLSDDKNGEFGRALEFLLARRGQPMLPDPGPAETQAPVGIPAADDADLLAVLARFRAQGGLRATLAALEQGAAEELEAGALLLRIAACRQALRGFHRLLRQPQTPDSDFVALLSRQLWMLGHDCSERLNPGDFLASLGPEWLLLRRPDDTAELICIGTPMSGEAEAVGERLLDYDPDYDGWFPGAELTIRLGRVQHALDRLQALPGERWGTHPSAITARILLGHSRGDPKLESALEAFAARQHEIAIQSFDQLDRFAVRSLASLQQRLKQLD